MFSQTGEFFKVTFKANNEHNGLNNRQKSFLRFNDKSEITIKEYMLMFGVVRNTATKDLNELSDKRMLEKVKNGKQIIYKKLSVKL